jgi:plastocyanin
MTKPGRITAALAALVGAAAFGTSLASAASDQITAVTFGGPSGCCSYSAPAYNLDTGAIAQFRNADPGVSHDVRAMQKGPDGKPLFESGRIKDATVPVDGTQYLAPGNYVFFCSIHGFQQMHATLTVSGGTPPVARPKIDLTIPGQTLAAVRRSGKVAVKVKAKTAARGVDLVVRKGARKLASKQGLKLAAGAARTLKLPLTGSGRAALKNAKSAGIVAQGTVPFGRPDTARRTLR